MSFNWLVSAFTFLSSCDESRPFNTELYWFLSKRRAACHQDWKLDLTRRVNKNEQLWKNSTYAPFCRENFNICAILSQKFNICAILSQKFQHMRHFVAKMSTYAPLCRENVNICAPGIKFWSILAQFTLEKYRENIAIYCIKWNIVKISCVSQKTISWVISA